MKIHSDHTCQHISQTDNQRHAKAGTQVGSATLWLYSGSNIITPTNKHGMGRGEDFEYMNPPKEWAC